MLRSPRAEALSYSAVKLFLKNSNRPTYSTPLTRTFFIASKPTLTTFYSHTCMPDKTDIPYRLRTRSHNMTLINKTKFLTEADYRDASAERGNATVSLWKAVVDVPRNLQRIVFVTACCKLVTNRCNYCTTRCRLQPMVNRGVYNVLLMSE